MKATGIALLIVVIFFIFMKKRYKIDPLKLKEEQKKWKEENEAFGQRLGYPQCCIDQFCNEPPYYLENSKIRDIDYYRYKAACINNNYLGFIPCDAHAMQILNNEIRLQDLIKNRDIAFPPFLES